MNMNDVKRIHIMNRLDDMGITTTGYMAGDQDTDDLIQVIHGYDVQVTEIGPMLSKVINSDGTTHFWPPAKSPEILAQQYAESLRKSGKKINKRLAAVLQRVLA